MSVKLTWHGDRAIEAIQEALKTALLTCGADLQRKSSEQAPKDTGDLRGNCAVDDGDLDGLSVRVGYSLPYAMVQHERLDYHHTDGKAKYLEDPFNENIDKYQKTMKETAKRGLNR